MMQFWCNYWYIWTFQGLIWTRVWNTVIKRYPHYISRPHPTLWITSRNRDPTYLAGSLRLYILREDPIGLTGHFCPAWDLLVCLTSLPEPDVFLTVLRLQELREGLQTSYNGGKKNQNNRESRYKLSLCKIFLLKIKGCTLGVGLSLRRSKAPIWMLTSRFELSKAF